MQKLQLSSSKCHFLNRPNDGNLSLNDEMNVDFAGIVKISFLYKIGKCSMRAILTGSFPSPPADASELVPPVKFRDRRLSALPARGSCTNSIASFFKLRIAQSSRVSAASYLPCRRYRAPRFFNVVLNVGESTLAALCHPPYSPYGAQLVFLSLFSSRSSATYQSDDGKVLCFYVCRDFVMQ